MLSDQEIVLTFGGVAQGDSILDQTFSANWALVLATRDAVDPERVTLLVSESADTASTWISRFRTSPVKVKRRTRPE